MMKNTRARCAYDTPGIGLLVHGTITVRAIFLVNRLVHLHAVSLPLSLFKLERKKASCYRDLSETSWALGMILVSNYSAL